MSLFLQITQTFAENPQGKHQLRIRQEAPSGLDVAPCALGYLPPAGFQFCCHVAQSNSPRKPQLFELRPEGVFAFPIFRTFTASHPQKLPVLPAQIL